MKAARLLPAIVLAALAGCTTVGPDYKRPEVQVPASYRTTGTSLSEADAADLVNTPWWENFRDAELNALVRTALKENRDLKIAVLRVQEYGARLQVSEAAQSPQLAYGSLANRQRLSQDRVVPLPLDTPLYNNSFEISGTASWEIDFWGRIRRSNEAARAALLAAEQSQRTVLMTLVGNVATGYLQLLCLDAELELLRRITDSAKESLRVFTAKVQGGGATPLQLAQVRAFYEQTAAAIPPKERDIALQENALSILIGSNPGPIRRGSKLQSIAIPAVPEGIPSQILERRPDVLKAEQDMVAANARIGLAKSQYFPSIALTGNFGWSATQLSDLFMKTANFGLLGAALSGPIFDGGRIEGDVRFAEATQKESVQAYLSVLQTAIREVDDALIQNRKSGEQYQVQGRQVEALRDYAALSRKRYEGGASSYLEVLDAERSLIAGELTRVSTQRDVYSALVAIYKSMGGGWIAEAEKISAARSPEGTGEKVEERSP